MPASVFIPRPRVESVLVRLERRPAPAVDPGARVLRAAGRGGPGRVRPAAQDAAALAGRRRRPRGLRAGRRAARRPGRGARRRRVGQAGGAREHALLAPAKLTVSLRVTGVRARRLPRARRRDGHARAWPTSSCSTRADPASSSRPSRACAPTTCRGRRPSNLVARALAACGRTAAVRLTKRIPSVAGWAVARPTRRPSCAGPGAPTRRWRRASGPTCPSAWWAAGPGSQGLGERVTPLPFEAREYLLLLPPFGVDTARVYRAWDARSARDEAPNALAAAALAVEPRLAALARRPAGAGRQRADAGRQRVDLVRRAAGRRRPGTAATAETAAGGGLGPAGAGPHGAGGLGGGLRDRGRAGAGEPGATCRPGAASGWPSASSCASSCASACGAS